MVTWIVNPTPRFTVSSKETYSITIQDGHTLYFDYPEAPFDEDAFWAKVEPNDTVFMVEHTPEFEEDGTYKPIYASVYQYDGEGILIADVTDEWEADL